MSTRADLIAICEEINIDFDEYESLEDVRNAIREYADKKLNKKYHISADNLSDTLKKFLVYEYDYIIKDKDGNIQEI